MPKDNIPSFLRKLYEIIDTCEPSIASWTDTGLMFVIRDSQEFEHKVIPKYFDTIKFTSFTRQLNMYGFQKMQSEAVKNAVFDPEIAKHHTFYHSCFQRGKEELLREIKRTSNSKMGSSSCSSSSSSEMIKSSTTVGKDTASDKKDTNFANLQVDKSRSQEQQKEITSLKDRVDALEQMVERLQGIIEYTYKCNISTDALMIHEKKQDDAKAQYMKDAELLPKMRRCSSAKRLNDPVSITEAFEHDSDSQPLSYQLDSGSLKQSLDPTEIAGQKKKVQARYSSAKIQHEPCDHNSDSQPLPYKLDSGSLQQSLYSMESTELRFISNFSDEHRGSQTSSVSMINSNSSCPLPWRRTSASKRRKCMNMSQGSTTTCIATSNRASSAYSLSSEQMSKATLPPHPKSKDHLPPTHDISHFPINNSERASSLTSLASVASVELSRSLFDETRIPSDSLVPNERDLSFSSYLSKMTL